MIFKHNSIPCLPHARYRSFRAYFLIVYFKPLLYDNYITKLIFQIPRAAGGMFHSGTLSLGAKRSGTKKFSSLTLENFKYQRFRNGPSLEHTTGHPRNLNTKYTQ